MSAGDVPLPFDWVPPAITAGQVEWAYDLNPPPSYHVRICPATCRPFYKVPETGEQWADAAERLHGFAPSKMISLNKQFGVFVTKYGRYPTPAEFLVFLYNRYIHHGQHWTLPAQIIQLIDETFNDFNDIIQTVSATEFTRRFMASVPIAARMEMETAV
jgi:hypothetical protein